MSLRTERKSGIKRQDRECWDKLGQRMQDLEDSNQTVKDAMQQAAAGTVGTMNTLYEEMQADWNKLSGSIGAAAKQFISSSQKAMAKLHEQEERYWRARYRRNAWICIYLAVTPALVLLDTLIRLFG